MLWGFPAECAAATGAAISDAPAAADFVSPADAATLDQRQINARLEIDQREIQQQLCG
jgi:hypothetical protein